MTTNKSVKFTLMRSGGVAGIRPPSIVLVASGLPDDVAQRLEQLLEEAAFFELPSELPERGPSADNFQYSLEVRRADGRTHTVTFAEASAGEALRELKRLVREYGQR